LTHRVTVMVIIGHMPTEANPTSAVGGAGGLSSVTVEAIGALRQDRGLLFASARGRGLSPGL
jgi:hypothetical protein